MASPVNDSYAVTSGQTIYGGRTATPLPSWVLALPLWQWYEIPNTALSSVAPSPTPPGDNGPASKITGWCGATLRRSGSIYMMAAAGGHKDYFGNEHDEVALNVETPGWVQRKASSTAANIHQNTPIYKDLTRSASHTYWATQYDNVNDRLLIASTGSPFQSASVPDCDANWPYQAGYPTLMGLTRSTNTWTAPDELANFPYATTSADTCCSHPLTSDVYYVKSGQGRLYKYSPTTNTWTNVGALFLNGGYAGSAIDPIRNRMLVVGDVNTIRPPEVHSILDGSQVSVTFGGLGSSALVMGGYPGAVYDEANDTFLVAKNNATIDVYRIDASTYSVDLPTITGTKPAQRTNSICNSFQYVPELKGVVIANSYTGNVQFMRTHL